MDNTEKVVSIDLIPVEEYTETRNPDNSKRFTCERCGKCFKQKQGVKQHILQVHVSKGEVQVSRIFVPESKSKKRKADNVENVEKSQSKKPSLDEESVNLEDEGSVTYMMTEASRLLESPRNSTIFN